MARPAANAGSHIWKARRVGPSCQGNGRFDESIRTRVAGVLSAPAGTFDSGSKMGAAIYRQMRSETVRRRDRGCSEYL